MNASGTGPPASGAGVPTPSHDPQADDDTPRPATVETLAGGRYELGPLLGAGGMGLVRRARDTVLHRDVAVKLLADNLAADADARERFLREARAAARINHPHVVVVHDAAEADGRPYLVMELVDGPSLADVLRRDGPLPPDEVAAVAAQALAGLAAAHTAGVLHRDVKPANLLRSPDGDVKVADFGVAEAADVPGLTRTGFVLGTRSYLAPERLRGAPASERTDLYALGATLVELSTGTAPTDGSSATAPDVPGPLGRLIRRLTVADPQARPASAEAALLALAGGEVPAATAAYRDLDLPATRPLPLEATRPAGVPDDHEAAPPTEPLAANPARPATPLRGSDVTTPDGATTPGGPDDTTTPDRTGATTTRRLLVPIGLAVVALVVLFRLVEGEAPTTADDADTATAPTDRVTDASDTATEPDANATDAARDLARWLRERADD